VEEGKKKGRINTKAMNERKVGVEKKKKKKNKKQK